MKTDKTIDNLMYTNMMLESLLKVFKSQMFHEIKLRKIAEEKKIFESCKNTKQKSESTSRLKKIERIFKGKIKKCEKYNSETLNLFKSMNLDKPNLDFVIESSHDLYHDFFEIFVRTTDGCNKDNPISIIPAILVKDPNGEFEYNNEKFKVNI